MPPPRRGGDARGGVPGGSCPLPLGSGGLCGECRVLASPALLRWRHGVSDASEASLGAIWSLIVRHDSRRRDREATSNSNVGSLAADRAASDAALALRGTRGKTRRSR